MAFSRSENMAVLSDRQDRPALLLDDGFEFTHQRRFVQSLAERLRNA